MRRNTLLISTGEEEASDAVLATSRRGHMELGGNLADEAYASLADCIIGYTFIGDSDRVDIFTKRLFDLILLDLDRNSPERVVEVVERRKSQYLPKTPS